MNKDIRYRDISQLVENLFPSFYAENGGMFISFIKAYYEWQETTKNNAFNEGRNLIELDDIDTTVDEFVEFFKNKYLQNFPYRENIDTRFLIKHIMDFYRTKGSKKSLELLIKLLFGEETEIYYPANDILKASTSEWFEPEYIEVTMSDRTKTFIDKKIIGSNSGASAFVDSIVRKKINKKLIDIIYISNVKGKFKKGELLTDNHSTKDSPMIIGSLTYFDVENGGRDNSIGNIFNVIAAEGKDGKVRVVETKDYTGRVDFKLIDGGGGYTIDDNTQVYISDVILGVENKNYDFHDYETVFQPIYKIFTYNSDFISKNAKEGDIILGYNSDGKNISEGIFIKNNYLDQNNEVTEEKTGTSLITVLNSVGSFDERYLIELDKSPIAKEGEYITQSSVVEIDYDTLVGDFQVGETVEIIQYAAGTNNSIITSFAFGEIEKIDDAKIRLKNFWGNFKENTVIRGTVSNATANAKTKIIINYPSRAKIVKVSDKSVLVSDISGEFKTGDLVKCENNDTVLTIENIENDGVTNIALKNHTDNQGIVFKISYQPNEGMVVGQNENSIGLCGKNTDFYFSENFKAPIFTDRKKNDIVKYITFKSTGHGASFAVGGLENEETFTVNTDMLSSHNIADVPFLNVRLNTFESGMGVVNNFKIIDGGTGYKNGSVITTKGGGYDNQDVRFQAMAKIVTDENGKIIDFTEFSQGSGYYNDPEIVLPKTTGTPAKITIDSKYGYGFIGDPFSNLNTIIADALSYKTISAGKISYLSKINPGNNYNVKPFIKIRNNIVYQFHKKDVILSIKNLKGIFIENEPIYQIIDGKEFVKGHVKNFTNGALFVRRENFNLSFSKTPNTTDYMAVYGKQSGASADIENIFDDESSLTYGENAIVDTKVIAANGVITKVEVIDSGYGYVDGKATLQSENSQFIVSGTIKIENHGKGTGFWKSTSSHLNSEKRIHDNNYYQEYSYDIISSLSLDKYSVFLKKLIHIAGTKMFGSIKLNSKEKIDVDSEVFIEKFTK